MARGDRRRSGLHRSGSVPTAGPLEILWRFRPPGNACYSDPTPHGDRLYVVGSQGDIGTIYALSRADGTVAWSCQMCIRDSTVGVLAALCLLAAYGWRVKRANDLSLIHI